MNNQTDSTINNLIQSEIVRQKEGITLIASENYAYQEVLEALGSALTNKYAEGYPGSRYYAGCKYVDRIEREAIERCKSLFNAPHANVQPHSGSNANEAVFLALLKPGDTIMGMSMASGGHLTHGHGVNFSGIIYKPVSYTVNRDTERIDYDDVELLAHEHKPRLLIAGASSYSRVIDIQRMKRIANSIHAVLLVDCAHTAGLIVAGVYPNPVGIADIVTATTHKTLRGPRGGFIMCTEKYKERIDRAVFPGLQGGPFMNAIAGKAICFKFAQEQPYTTYIKQALVNAQSMVQTFKELGYRIVSDGTDTHLFVIDLRDKNITGKGAEEALEEAGISTSRSMIPFDQESPRITSGIRLGTLALTAEGLHEKSCSEIAIMIDEVIKNPHNHHIHEQVKARILKMKNYDGV